MEEQLLIQGPSQQLALPSNGTWGSNSGRQTCQQVPSPAQPYYQSLNEFLKVLIFYFCIFERVLVERRDCSSKRQITPLKTKLIRNSIFVLKPVFSLPAGHSRNVPHSARDLSSTNEVPNSQRRCLTSVYTHVRQHPYIHMNTHIHKHICMCITQREREE